MLIHSKFNEWNPSLSSVDSYMGRGIGDMPLPMFLLLGRDPIRRVGIGELTRLNCFGDHANFENELALHSTSEPF